MYIELKLLWSLEDQHDRAPKTEPTHLFPRSKRLPEENLARVCIDRFHERTRRRSAPAYVCAQLGVEVEENATDVCRPYRRHAEEPVTPSPEKRDSFVQDEEIGKSFRDIWRNAEELANEVPSSLDDPCSGRVKTVVVARCEVDNREVQSVIRISLVF